MWDLEHHHATRTMLLITAVVSVEDFASHSVCSFAGMLLDSKQSINVKVLALPDTRHGGVILDDS